MLAPHARISARFRIVGIGTFQKIPEQNHHAWTIYASTPSVSMSAQPRVNAFARLILHFARSARQRLEIKRILCMHDSGHRIFEKAVCIGAFAFPSISRNLAAIDRCVKFWCMEDRCWSKSDFLKKTTAGVIVKTWNHLFLMVSGNLEEILTE